MYPPNLKHFYFSCSVVPFVRCDLFLSAESWGSVLCSSVLFQSVFKDIFPIFVLDYVSHDQNKNKYMKVPICVCVAAFFCLNLSENQAVEIIMLVIGQESVNFFFFKAALKFIWNCCHSNKALRPNLQKCSLLTV